MPDIYPAAQLAMRRIGRTLCIPAIPALLLALAACRSDSTEQANPSPCVPQAAQRLVGQPRPADAEVRRLTGARLVRQIRPGQAVTFDYRLDRVTITSDPATGRVTQAGCG